jgi:pimeloyl-ACP methyl ester carboxylesterase
VKGIALGPYPAAVDAVSMCSVEGHLEIVTVEDAALMTCRWGRGAAGEPTIVLLHEGLGSITQWRDIPELIHARTGLPVMAYDRGGYGRSSPAPAVYATDFMHREARDVLPSVLASLGIDRPVLVGHSDGASIALIAAGEGTVSPLAVGAIAPHIHVEPVCIRGIRDIATQRDQVVAGLARHHEHPELVFDRWRDVWLSPGFASWDISGYLPDIAVPVVAAQGDRDEYATTAMIVGITAEVPDSTGRILPDCGHVAHRDQPELVLELVDEVVSRAVAA